MTPTADTQLRCAAFGATSATNVIKATAAHAIAALRTASRAGISTDKASDESLVARVAEGDRRAMQLLFVRHQQRVHRFVLRLTANSATAEDIVSEVFFEVWRQAASFEGRAQLSTWLLAIARNKALTAMRRRIDQPLDDAMEVADSASTAEETLAAGNRSALLRQCLGQLSASHREIIDLVYYHEKSVDEVSIIVGVPTATVKTRMFYARKRLAELLRAAGVETSHS